MDDGREVVALLLDVPEPLPWERITWSLSRSADGSGPALEDHVLAWSEKGTRAILVREGGATFGGGAWTLDLTLRLEVGGERAVWRRGGTTGPEVGGNPFQLG